MIFVTGGAGFIGANFVLDWLANTDESVVNIDKLTYAGNLENLSSVFNEPRHIFVQADIGDGQQMAALLAKYQPRAVVNFAAESLRRMAEWTRDHFDARIFQAFVKSIGIYPVGSLVRLTSGRIGVVTEQSPTALTAPMARCFSRPDPTCAYCQKR